MKHSVVTLVNNYLHKEGCVYCL